MKELSFEKMELIDGGSCTGAILTAVGCGLLVGAASYINPAIWLSPNTWYGAATLFAGNAANIYSECY